MHDFNQTKNSMSTTVRNAPLRLSVVIPVFNEENTLQEILALIERVNIPHIQKEIIIVDDASTDMTRSILTSYQGRHRIIFQEKNCGKGACVREGFKVATGDFIIIQDADLEYDPEDYSSLIAPLQSGNADVVYGTRFSGKRPYKNESTLHHYANIFLTFFSNACSGLQLTDVETCYKIFTKQALASFKDKLTSNRFGIDLEITALVAKNKLRITEVPVSYNGRTHTQGKKIGWKDGVAALRHILYFNLIR